MEGTVTFADLPCQVIKVMIIHDGIVLQGEIFCASLVELGWVLSCPTGGVSN